MSVLKGIVAAVVIVSACASVSVAQPARTPLPSWNDAAPKKAIVAFVERVTEAGSPDFVPVAGAHRDVRQRRHAVGRAADVLPAALRARPREGARPAASGVEGRRSRSPRCSRAT